MKILVTGGGGFLGNYIAKGLVHQGHDVTSFSRRNYPDLIKDNISSIQGDLILLKDIMSASEGMDAIFHVASKVGMWGRYKDFFEANVIGTQNVLKACENNNISKLVFTSSPSVAFGKDDLVNVDELHPYPEKYLSYYAQTKSEAEQLVLNANSEKLATVAIRPHLIFGPGDNHLFPQIVSKARAGKVRKVGDGKNKVDVIYVENAADAHLQAFSHLEISSQVAGNAYFVGQEKPVVLWDFVNEILKRNNISQVSMNITAKKAYFFGTILEGIYKAFRIKNEPPMTRFIAKQLSCSHYFNHGNAKNDFGYYPKFNISDALDKTIK